MKALYLIAAGALFIILILPGHNAEARSLTGPLQMIKDSLDPISGVFNQQNLLANQDAQAVLILRTVAIIKIFLEFLAILFVILILYGGYLWLTAAGNEQRVEEAKHVIQRAIIGVIIILGAVAITNFILNEITSAMLE